MIKPYSAACDNNRQPILEIIEVLFADCKEILEIGSGTGQHAVYFAGETTAPDLAQQRPAGESCRNRIMVE